jgi:hypothetical protein
VPPPDDGIPSILTRIQRALEAHDNQALLSLFHASAEPEQSANFVEDLADPDIQRVVVHERDGWRSTACRAATVTD